jgi:hypothetical protein
MPNVQPLHSMIRGLVVVCMIGQVAPSQEDRIPAKARHQIEKMVAEPLKGISQVGLQCVGFGSDGIDEKYVTDIANHVFQQNGIPAVSLDSAEYKSKPSSGYLLLMVTGTRVGTSRVMNVFLKLSATTLLTTPTLYGKSETTIIWETWEDLIVSGEAQVKQNAKENIEKVAQKFSLDYLRANEP